MVRCWAGPARTPWPFGAALPTPANSPCITGPIRSGSIKSASPASQPSITTTPASPNSRISSPTRVTTIRSGSTAGRTACREVFVTLPSPDDTRNAKYNPKGLFNFRFQIGSCANQNPLHGVGHREPTYENLNRDWADKVHFHMMNGDWLYEELREYPPEAWRLTQGLDEAAAARCRSCRPWSASGKTTSCISVAASIWPSGTATCRVTSRSTTTNW